MQFREWLTFSELFQAAPFKWTAKKPDLWVAEWQTQDRGFQAVFGKIEGEANAWEFDYAQTFPTHSMGITGGGNAAHVFSAVMSVLGDFVKEVHPDTVIFSAQEPSRQSLYSKMLGRLARQFGYTFTERPGYGGKKEYVVVRAI